MLTFPPVSLFCPSKSDAGTHSSFNVSEHGLKLYECIYYTLRNTAFLISRHIEDFMGLFLIVCDCLADSNLHDST